MDLQQLDCSGTQVSNLAPLSGLTALQHLDCSSTQVSDLAPLSGLAALQHLDCSYTQVSDLAPLSGLAVLQHLDCSRIQISDLAPLSGLAALQHLDCYDTQVSDLAPLSGLAILQHLDCSITQVSDLAPLSGLAALQHLGCSGTQVSDLVPLSELAALQHLGCYDTQVSDLAPLSGLATLQHLDCSITQVPDLAPLSGLAALQHLDCSRTQVSDLAPLSGLAVLQHLDCVGTQVSDLAPLSGLAALQHLDCSDTQVSDLAPLSGLTALQYLDLSGCRLDRVPPSVFGVPSLETLILFDSHVRGIPATGVLSSSKFENCLNAVRAHFADLANGAVDAPDVKLLLLGNGGAGKTQIARWLAGDTFQSEWNSTHGIRIGTAPLPGEPLAQLHVWDFGGQDIYHGTHALFLRSPAILVPVWAEDTEQRETHEHGGLTFRNQPLDYWIDVARHQGHPDSPVLIVQSKCDRPDQEVLPFPIRQQSLTALRYRKQLHVSAKANRGREMFEVALRDAVAWLRDPERLGTVRIGAGRLRVQRRLEAMRDADMLLPPNRRRHRLLEQEEFEAICAEEGGVNSPAHLLAYLDANGTVLHRPGLFHGRIVLDQGWALEAIYAVFDRAGPLTEIRRAGGRFSRSVLGLSIWQDHSEAEQKLFVSMMRSCGICFLHRRFGDDDDEDGEYIAPDLLPERSAIAAWLPGRWDSDGPVELAVFRHALLHGGLIRTIMSQIGEAAGPDALYWQGGVCGYETTTGSRLLIEQEMTGPWQGAIRVRTQRGQAAALLGRLMEMVEQAQAHLGLQALSMERSSAAAEPQRMTPTAGRPPVEFGQEKAMQQEWYVSYAWRDDLTPAGQEREKVVDDLCAAAITNGFRILRDKERLGLGESISAFMRRIGAANRVFVILSEKYLRSPYCMFELAEVWRTSRQEGPALLERVRVYTLDDASIWTPLSRARYAAYWKKEHDEMEAFVRDNGGTSILGERDFAAFRRMGEFYRQVGDILATLADIVQPRSIDELKQYGFDRDLG